jgi:putative transposase
MEEGRDRYGVRICGYVLMETHWHQAVWIRDDDGRTAAINYLRRLSSRHALQFRSASGTRGDGHVYQDRYKAKAAQTEEHYLTLVRYIERNPLAAGIVDRAEKWPWSSLAERVSGRSRVVEAGPVPLPDEWAEIVNGPSVWGTEVEEGTEVGTGTEVRVGTEVAQPL